MRIFIILIATILGLVGCNKTPELHAIGIYEGHDYENTAYKTCRDLCVSNRKCQLKCERPAWPGKTSMTVPVNINRPQKSITLVLGSYDPIQWEITRQSSTEINQIILIGYGADEANVVVNGDIYSNVIRQRDIRSPYEPQGENFRSLVNKVPKSLGFERLASFQGNYRAPEDGFHIFEIQTNTSNLDPDYLRHKIEAINTDINIRLYGVVAGQSGEFLPNGIFVSPLALTPSFKLAVSANHKTGYLYTSKGIRQIFASDEGGSDFGLIPLPSKNLKLGHFKAIALDEKRNRILVIFQAGGGESVIMALDLKTNNWSKFGSTGRNEPHSLFYDVDNDRFLISVSNFSEKISIGTLNAVSGQYQTLRQINSTEFEGLADLYDPGNRSVPYIYIAGVSGLHISLATDGMDIFSRSTSAAGPFRRIYTLDLKTGDLKLTYYD